jgi:hypothetical protein
MVNSPTIAQDARRSGESGKIFLVESTLVPVTMPTPTATQVSIDSD